VRHPIYLGWFILTAGYVMTYPNVLNALAVIGTLPFMMWRIILEEELLCEDPSYRAYAEQVRYRLIPWLF
jgi:protein-S-isoprenylcysteine O-methyltransferase Ste14